jgi:hypothetical protein
MAYGRTRAAHVMRRAEPAGGVTVVRVTATGAALATITVPRPYGTFIGVTAAADNRTFVLAAQELARLPLRTPPATRFFLLRIDPASRVPASRAQLTPLPIPEQHTGPRRLSAGPAGQPVSTAADRQRHPARPHRRLLQPRAQCRYPRQRPLHPHPVVQPHLRGRLAALTQRLPHRAGTDPHRLVTRSGAPIAFRYRLSARLTRNIRRSVLEESFVPVR